MEEDTSKVTVRYRVQGGETERGKLIVEREQEWVEGLMARDVIIIIIIMFLGCISDV